MITVIVVGALLAAALAAWELNDASRERKRLRLARWRYIYGRRP